MEEKYIRYFYYYAELERDLFSTESYVTIEEDNFKTFSTKYIQIYQSICSEIDSLLKELCRNVRPGSRADKLGKYYEIINSNFRYFKDETVLFNKQKIELSPWKAWSEDSAPDWWTYYNKVKHKRLEADESGVFYYKYANLENVLNALAALYIVEQYYIYSYDFSKEIIIPDEYKSNERYKLKEIKNKKSNALRINQSIKCIMKRWYDNGCYTGFLGQSFFEIDKLTNIMEK